MTDLKVMYETTAKPGVAAPEPHKADPCALVLFGASGDLARRKILPAIYNLARDKALPEQFVLIGSSRSMKSADEFRMSMRDAIGRFSRTPLDEQVWRELAGHVDHLTGDPREPGVQAQLRERLAEVDRVYDTQGHHVFCLATPPSSMPSIIRQLGEAGLLATPPGQGPRPFPRVIVEKPFGLSVAGQHELNALLAQVDETQVFRIDHYLGKETVQNILVFRFGNSVFEPVWNSKYVDHVQITAAEEIGVEGRGQFYEETGVMRDVVQNHLLQVLSLCAMEPPISFHADSIHDEKVKVLRSIRPMAADAIGRDAVFAQYRGYRGEPQVASDSTTPTYAAMKVMIDNWRWRGVPFYLRAGKRLQSRLTEVTVAFQAIPFCLFGPLCPLIPRNELRLRIQPDEGIALRFVSKEPGENMAVRPVTMDFSYARAFEKKPHEAYERLILDFMRGDQTLFAGKLAVELEWQFAMPVIDAWERRADGEIPIYEDGSAGPAEAEELIARDGRSWRSLV